MELVREEALKAMRKLIFASTLLASLMYAGTTIAAQCGRPDAQPPPEQFAALSGNEVRIADWEWTDEIEDHCPIARRNSDSSFGAPVTLWMRIEGTREAWQRMRNEKRLPLIHVWEWQPVGMEFLRDADTSIADEYDPIDRILLSETRPSVIEALGREVEDRTFFDLRTWSRKRNLIQAKWRVRVIDQTGTTIECAKNLKCDFEFVAR